MLVSRFAFIRPIFAIAITKHFKQGEKDVKKHIFKKKRLTIFNFQKLGALQGISNHRVSPVTRIKPLLNFL